MEQKQLDEIDESYFGEEFVEEGPVKEIKKDNAKSTKPKKTKKTTKKVTAKTTKSDKKVTNDKDNEKEEKKDEVSITPAKEEVKETNVEPSIPVDPWASEESENSGFGVGTWKAITGILLILLVFSVFTDGFDFAEGTNVEGKALLLSEAESKALEFVNNNLLQPPFVAEIESSSEVNGLYKVSLSVAGQSVDSYLTKDGNLFFPQGFEMNAVGDLAKDSEGTEEVLSEELTDDLEIIDVEETEEVGDLLDEEIEGTNKEMAMEEVAEESSEISNEISEEAKVDVIVEEVTEESTTKMVVEDDVSLTGDVKTFQLVAKKWSFSPDSVTVKKGDVVKFNIAPDTSKAAFALNEFTFAITGLDVEEEILGTTVVEFTASNSGNFDFTCSDCEDWRGMSGTLIVE